MSFALLALPLLTQATSSAVPAPSPAETDLICSPTNSSDCYPRVLVPTKDFQPIREGQDIPSGLHVRLNVYTGEREARLNIPMEGEEGAELESIQTLPTEQAVIVVEQPEPSVQDKPQIPAKAPVYDTAGKISPPPPDSGDDMSTFQKAILITKMEARGFDAALDDLKDLSHDIYYGLEIAKDGPVVEKLVCLALGSGSEKIPAGENGRDRRAASILGNSIQNNPTALKELGAFWKSVMYPVCPLDKAPGTSNFVSILRTRLGAQKDPAALKAKITTISRLLREPQIRENFLANGGMELLLAVFLKKGEEFDTVRMKVGELITDNFLDEHMGASLGVFPKRPVTEKKICEGDKKRMLEDGCWEAHIEGFLEKKADAEWATEFLALLREQRRKWGGSIKDREL